MQHPDPTNPQSPEDVQPDVRGALLCAASALAEIAEASSVLLRAAESVSDALDHLARLDPAITVCDEETAGEPPLALEIAGLAVSLSPTGEVSIEKSPRRASRLSSVEHE
tara:strand:+ start:1752 stop:2081 length:330 start_codon:yes stop_codon:yes gene_type:complete